MSRAGGTTAGHMAHRGSSLTGGASTLDRQPAGTGPTERQWRAARRVQAVMLTSRSGRGGHRHGDTDSMTRRNTIRYDYDGRRASRPFHSFSQVRVLSLNSTLCSTMEPKSL